MVLVKPKNHTKYISESQQVTTAFSWQIIQFKCLQLAKVIYCLDFSVMEG